jgi:hypothetical protein
MYNRYILKQICGFLYCGTVRFDQVWHFFPPHSAAFHFPMGAAAEEKKIFLQHLIKTNGATTRLCNKFLNFKLLSNFGPDARPTHLKMVVSCESLPKKLLTHTARYSRLKKGHCSSTARALHEPPALVPSYK